MAGHLLFAEIPTLCAVGQYRETLTDGLVQPAAASCGDLTTLKGV